MLKLLESVRGLRAQRGFGAPEAKLAFLGSWGELRLKVVHIVRLFALCYTEPRHVIGLTSFDRLRHRCLFGERLSETHGELLGQVAVAIGW